MTFSESALKLSKSPWIYAKIRASDKDLPVHKPIWNCKENFADRLISINILFFLNKLQIFGKMRNIYNFLFFQTLKIGEYPHQPLSSVMRLLIKNRLLLMINCVSVKDQAISIHSPQPQLWLHYAKKHVWLQENLQQKGRSSLHINLFLFILKSLTAICNPKVVQYLMFIFYVIIIMTLTQVEFK